MKRSVSVLIVVSLVFSSVFFSTCKVFAKDGKLMIYYNDSGVSKLNVENNSKEVLDNSHASERCMIGVENGWIYYYDYYLTSDIFGAIYKIKSDGTKKSEVYKSDEHLFNFFFYQGYIYFNTTNGYGLYPVYRIKTNETVIKRVADDIYLNKNSMIFDNGTIYYSDNDNYMIHSFNMNNASNKKLTGVNCYLKQISGEWIYYAEANKKTLDLYRMKKDGSQKIILAKNTSEFAVKGDWIFYADNLGNTYKSKLNGSSKQLLKSKLQVRSVNCLVGNWLIITCVDFNKDKTDLYKININTKQMVKVGEFELGSSYYPIDPKGTRVYGNIFYFYYDNGTTTTGGIYKADISGNNCNKLASCSDGDMIFSME